ncbi:MAG TPA: hypothetical protein VGI36_01140 [Candidatus Binataceae bacterium]
MIPRWSRRSALTTIAAAAALLAPRPALLRAQVGEGSMAQSAVGALTGEQQTAANSALCSAIGNQVPNPAAASPSLLSSPSIISAAATMFASSVHLPLPSATSLLQGYVSQHGSDILASCATSNVTSGLTSKVPGAGSLPSIPKLP